MEKETKQGEVLANNENGQNSVSDLIPIGIGLVDYLHEQKNADKEIKKEELRLKAEQLKVHQSSFSHKYWLLVLVTIAILGISIGLIFVKEDTTSGLSMLSHVGAVVVGIIAGSGWERIRSN